MATVRGERPRLGVMGGTFNPIHFGHLFTAEAARVEYSLDEVVFMPVGQSPKKATAGEASAEDRYTMTVLATVTNPEFSVSRLEIDRPGVTYTIDTLQQIHADLKDRADLFFITGADAVLEILTWKDPESLAGFCEFIAATRPGFELERFQKLIKKRPGLPLVHVMEIPALAISSTDLRRRVQSGLPIRYLLPDAVASYIQKAGLYR